MTFGQQLTVGLNVAFFMMGIIAVIVTGKAEPLVPTGICMMFVSGFYGITRIHE